MTRLEWGKARLEEVKKECPEVMEEHDKQIRENAIDEFYNGLLLHKSSINQANYPWNYVELVHKKLKEQNDEYRK